MELRYATLKDIDLLVKQRLEFVEAQKGTEEYYVLKENCRKYFEKALGDNSCRVVLAEKSGKCVGTGIVFYYDSVPSTFNVTGKNAYITSMYVDKAYRRKGIGSLILEKIVVKAEEEGYPVIMLNASEMGKPMYRKHGFMDSKNGMILDTRS